MAGIRIEGNSSGNVAEVAGTNQLKIIPEVNALTNSANIGGVREFSENDMGYSTGVPYLLSNEVDTDYRARVSLDIEYDDVEFNYTAQDTGKHSYSNTTMTNSWTAGQLTTNSGSITTTTTGTLLQTYAMFPVIGACTLAGEFVLGFSAQPQTNSFVEFGFALPGTATTAPTDGVFFRLQPSGLQGVASFNGAETTTAVFNATSGTGTWTYTNAKRYQFLVYLSATECHFWVNDGILGYYRLGGLALPSSQGRLVMSSALPMVFKHRITGGAAGGTLQATLNAYNVRAGGGATFTDPATRGNRMYGSYQGIQGGTMGTAARFGTITAGNEANVTAAVPTTTTAALGSGLGGKFWETASLAVNTDAIIQSYQVPAGTVNVPGKRLMISGIALTSYIQTVIAGGPINVEWFLAFGHTAVSLATAEAATTKAPRRIVLPQFTQVVTAAQAVNTMVSQPGGAFIDFSKAPIFVNPGEFVQLCKRHVGTVTTTGTFAHQVAYICGPE
jgi:hypothetical protein